MMTKNKQFEANGVKLNIKVEMNVSTERSPTGYHWHDITINDMGHMSNKYYKVKNLKVKNDTTKEIEALFLQSKIDEAMNDAIFFLNAKSNPIEDMFYELGFE